MTSQEIRKCFLDFFASKAHQIEPSAPIVVKNDPTLMFTNAGMNQFKDIFLNNHSAKYPRVSNSQKCLRVSGKHNDLEEVGKDTYHHTFFEMLGNWSFGDYFKQEAISWAWEFLTEIVKIDKENLYVTVFGGDKADGTEKDMEAYNFWKNIVSEDRILFGTKKDNFWEMGECGPCGPCSEIHVDIRSKEEKSQISGKDLVNKDHPHVIEIWNLVFIQYNRTANGQLELLPNKYVDTGMGFERLCMVLQGKQSNYDTDVFQPLIQTIAQMANYTYGVDNQKDIAVRVIADHLRAVSFTIADGQLPSNTGAGYVIRRILRRAVRYGFTFLDFNQPFICDLLSTLVSQMGKQFPEIIKQQDLIYKVIKEEELSFLRTLSSGIQKFEQYLSQHKQEKVINGNFAFELFDTYGFPIDLTCLMAEENGKIVDMKSFEEGLLQQKERSRTGASIATDDWEIVNDCSENTIFVGYDSLQTEVNIIRYRKVTAKDKTFYQLVLDKTPFYAEGGGQVGDTGILKNNTETIRVTNTKKENNLIVHLCDKLPQNLSTKFIAEVDTDKRRLTENNHSATHLLHFALRKVLGTHVEQKGSFVNSERLRFDFSHFSKMKKDELREVEKIVNKMIRANTPLQDHREVPINEANKMGAVALFGEKYGEKVRVVQFGKSVEFCGGTHASATGNIGLLRIVSESAIAAGIRRIEAVTAEGAEELLYARQDILEDIQEMCGNPTDITKAIHNCLEENTQLKKQVEDFKQQSIVNLYNDLKQKSENINGINYFEAILPIDSDAMKDIAYKFRGEFKDLCFVGANEQAGKVMLTIMLSDTLVEKGFDAGKIIREAAKFIKGGGGGQKFYATAGGKDSNGISEAMKYIKNEICK